MDYVGISKEMLERGFLTNPNKTARADSAPSEKTYLLLPHIG